MNENIDDIEIFKKYLSYENDIITEFRKIFFEKDKKQVANMMKHIYKNMKHDLDFTASIYSLPWCKLSNLTDERKKEIVESMSDKIREEGIECEECKLKRSVEYEK